MCEAQTVNQSGYNIRASMESSHLVHARIVDVSVGRRRDHVKYTVCRIFVMQTTHVCKCGVVHITYLCISKYCDKPQ